MRILVGALAAIQFYIGLWALFLPVAFYEAFPYGGTPWVALLPPYNEHLVRDVGWLNLALTVITVWAAISLARSLVLAVLAGWLVADLPHLVYHAAHLDALSTGDGTAEIISLALGPAIAAALLVLVARSDDGAGTTT